jgi:uncharacterized membrane protein
MNLKNFLGSSFAGFVVYYLLGWVFYVQIFPDLHPSDESTNMMFIALGCFFAALMLGYIYTMVGNITNWMTGLQVGAVIGAISSLSWLFFFYAHMPMDSMKFIKEFITSAVMSGLTGAVIAFVNGKLGAGTP